MFTGDVARMAASGLAWCVREDAPDGKALAPFQRPLFHLRARRRGTPCETRRKLPHGRSCSEYGYVTGRSGEARRRRDWRRRQQWGAGVVQLPLSNIVTVPYRYKARPWPRQSLRVSKEARHDAARCHKDVTLLYANVGTPERVSSRHSGCNPNARR